MPDEIEKKPEKRPGNPAWGIAGVSGRSGNPGGRSKEIEKIRRLARKKLPAAIERLDAIIHQEDAPPRAAIAAFHEFREMAVPPQAPEVNAAGEDLVGAQIENKPAEIPAEVTTLAEHRGISAFGTVPDPLGASSDVRQNPKE